MNHGFATQRWPTAAMVFVLFVSVGFAQHSGWWRKSTPNGQSRDCTVVESEEEMISELQAVGWDISTIPDINWKDDCAVVISPAHCYRGMELVFLKLEWRDNQYHLDWGWQPFRDEQTVRHPDGSYSKTSGSHTEGPETVVVSFKHSVHTNPFVCSEWKPE